MPQATAAPAMVAPSGTINIGQRETGIFQGHPSQASSPRIQFLSSSIGEGLVTIREDLLPNPMVAESWDISDDFLTWTWHIQPGIQFHKGYGELTTEDVVYSYEQWYEGALLARAGFIGQYFGFDGNADLNASTTILDDLTFEVFTGEPWVSARVFEFLRNGGGVSTWIVSKKQSEELGIEDASVDIASTGPWEIEEHASGQFWKFSAVQDHWRQTPYFEELVFWTIPEESARVAGFQTGNLDNFSMDFDSIITIEAVEGAVLKGVPNAGQAGINWYGQTYGLDRDGNEYEFYDPNQAWVSSDLDTNSKAWKDAVMVRKAMNIAIDRQTIVDTLLLGFGRPQYLRDWMGHEARANPDWVYEYDPVLAKQMLADAGYPNGFTITLTPAIRGAPAEVETCQSLAQYWEAIGINVKIQNVPYATIRPELITRKYQGITCLTVGVRLTPLIGASNYPITSTYSYGTHHPIIDEIFGRAAKQTDPLKIQAGELEFYNWMWDNAMASSIYVHDGVWPIGPRLDPDFDPADYSDVRTATGFEYVKHR
ncbi:MAG: ABC transporter substrate-binding protein [Chloroflexi bacterium]|nr:ABC transporter substrate-binding protein [Chloroflexota bacterium]